VIRNAAPKVTLQIVQKFPAPITAGIILVAVLVASFLLAGCGFHLRGSQTSDASITHVYVRDLTRNQPAESWLGGGPDEMLRTLTEVLASAGIDVSTSSQMIAVHPVATSTDNGRTSAGAAADASGSVSPANAAQTTADTLTIELLGETLQKRVASVAASAAAAEYQIDYTLRFRIVGDDGAERVKETLLKADRSYRYKADAIMGSADEEAMLQREMRRDMANQILRRLQQGAAIRQAHANQP
jgi:outer membrane lipopolysaccharide assembly protein LptE/RlpB